MNPAFAVIVDAPWMIHVITHITGCAGGKMTLKPSAHTAATLKSKITYPLNIV
jgi:hypothetical protein